MSAHPVLALEELTKRYLADVVDCPDANFVSDDGSLFDRSDVVNLYLCLMGTRPGCVLENHLDLLPGTWSSMTKVSNGALGFVDSQGDESMCVEYNRFVYHKDTCSDDDGMKNHLTKKWCTSRDTHTCVVTARLLGYPCQHLSCDDVPESKAKQGSSRGYSVNIDVYFDDGEWCNLMCAMYVDKRDAKDALTVLEKDARRFYQLLSDQTCEGARVARVCALMKKCK